MLGIDIKPKQILSYTLLPGIKPRLLELFGRGFEHVPYFIALVYQCVRLLPADHPYARAANIGRFGVRHVIAEAANHLVISVKNIDQIIIFLASLAGLVLMVMQLALLGGALFIQAASAAGFASFFTPPNAEQDLAHIFMDLVFGVPGIFNSCVAMGSACLDMNGNAFLMPGAAQPAGASPFVTPMSWPFPIHHALHGIFAIYSQALLIVAVFITLYFVATILAETAQTGTPFGKRYSHVWAPIRLVVAFGLLVPLSSGLNVSQHIVLHAAKYGSAFASNGWVKFNEVMNQSHSNAYSGIGEDGLITKEQGRLVTTPSIPEVSTLLQFMFVAKTCEYAVEHTRGNENLVKPYLVRGGMGDNYLELPDVSGNASSVDAINGALPYEELIAFANGSNRVTLRFGIHDADEYPRYKGNVNPVCGELNIELEDPRPSGLAGGASANNNGEYASPGPEILQRYYWYIIKELWWTNALFTLNTDEGRNYADAFAREYIASYDRDRSIAEQKLPSEDAGDFIAYLQDFYADELKNSVLDNWTFPPVPGASGQYSYGAIEAQQASGRWDVDGNLRDKGWGGAAIWYNKVAEMNGSVTSAALNIPMPTRYPIAMEYVRQVRAQNAQSLSASNPYNPDLGNGYVQFPDAQMAVSFTPMYKAYLTWSDAIQAGNTHVQPTGNAVVDTINALFGTSGLFSMRENADAHPLAQLVGLGRSLVDSSINNLGYAGMGGVAGLLFRTFDIAPGAAAAEVLADFMITIAMLGLTAGFLLFYIVPFLPFIYFFFALGGWVKGIFEAMVGAPLWALAHIRIDGNGLPGQAAMNGYFLIFEIFLRPILIIFGFLASILTYSATVAVLNDVFTLVTDNLAGFDAAGATSSSGSATGLDMAFFRGPIDELFFTIIYAIIVYMMGMASFKLIDLVPNNILRWMGQSVSTFNDSREDPAGRLTQTALVGGQQATQAIGTGVKQGVKGLSSLGGSGGGG